MSSTLRAGRRLVLSAVALATLASAAGCSDSVDPTVGTDQVFSMYGYLDPSSDRQALRIIEIGRTIGSDTLSTIDAVVTSTEAGSGVTTTWRDSLVTYANGATGHVFLADYTPTPNAQVTVTATAGDGRAATVSIAVPPLASATVGAPENVNGFTTFPVTVRDVPRVIGGTLRLRVTGLPTAPADTTELEIPVRAYDIQQSGPDWVVVVPFVEATQSFLRARNLFGVGLTLVEAEFGAFIANDVWDVPPGGLDEDAIIEPGTFTNVTGGFGFVGAGYEAPVRWLPSPGTQSRAGLAISGDPAALIAVNEVGPGYTELYNPSAEAVEVGGYVLTMGAPQEGVIIPNPSTVPPGGFLVVDGPFSVVVDRPVQFLSSSGRLIARNYPEADAQVWGAYPDGLSFVLPQGGPDIFRGPLQASPGGPNRPLFQPAVINEISTSGDGFVEVLPTYLGFNSARLSSVSRELAFNGVDASREGNYVVADEGGTLTLEQTGGTVYLLVNYGSSETPTEPSGYRVVDVRTFGPQDLSRSLGYLPDGPDGTWSEGLLPTRAAPNAAARFVSR